MAVGLQRLVCRLFGEGNSKRNRGWTGVKARLLRRIKKGEKKVHEKKVRGRKEERRRGVERKEDILESITHLHCEEIYYKKVVTDGYQWRKYDQILQKITQLL